MASLDWSATQGAAAGWSATQGAATDWSASWFDTVASEANSDPNAAAAQYGDMARGLPAYLSGDVQAGTQLAATAIASTACLAANVAAPVCALGVMLISAAVQGGFEGLISLSRQAPQSLVAPIAPPSVSSVMVVQLAQASEDMRKAEQAAIDALVKPYSAAIAAATGYAPDPSAARQLAIQALTGQNYPFTLIAALPSYNRQTWGSNPDSGFDEWNALQCSDSRSVVTCLDGNNLWMGAPESDKKAWAEAFADVAKRGKALPGAALLAASRMAQLTAVKLLQIEDGRNRAGAAESVSAAAAAPVALAAQGADAGALRIEAGGDLAVPTGAAGAAQGADAGVEAGGDLAVPTGAAGIGTGALILGGLALLFLLVKKGR